MQNSHAVDGVYDADDSHDYVPIFVPIPKNSSRTGSIASSLGTFLSVWNRWSNTPARFVYITS